VSPSRPPTNEGSNAVAASDTDAALKIVEDSVLKLWATVDELSRIVPTIPEFYRVTIFGSSRMNRGDPLYDEVRRLASELAGMGCDIVTGGGPGLMQAANEGERLGDVSGRTRSIGLNVELPHEQAPNPFVEKLYQHGTFFSRLHHFVRLSSSFVVMRGGVGTTLETMLVWQLCQVRHLYDRPLILVGAMWKDLIEWAHTHMLDDGRGLASRADLDIPICVENVDEAVAVIREDRARWEKLRAE